MATRVTRRQAMATLGAASASFVFSGRALGLQSDLRVGGRPVEIVVDYPPTWSGRRLDNAVRVTVRPIIEGTARAEADLGVLSAAGRRRPQGTRAPADLAQVRIGRLTVRLAGGRPALTIEDGEGKLVQRLVFDPDKPTLTFALGTQPVLGFGEGGAQFDRRGAIDPMRNGQASYRSPTGQGGYALRTHGGRVPVAWLIGTGGWGLYVHQPSGTFDLTGADGVFTPRDDDAPFDVIVVSAADPAVMMRVWADITGPAEMPPLWSLGYLQSHRTLSGPDEVMTVAQTFREKRLPCDAVIYLGTDFTPSGWNTHNGEFTWNPDNFPDPKAMVDALHGLNFKVVLHIVVEGRRFTGTVSDPCTADALPPGRTSDGNWPPERQVSCYWPAHKPLYDVGIDGWWPDQGDGYDEASRLARIRMYWEGSQQWRPNERPFALHRNGQAGMQRYAAFLWSGDVYSTWETLRLHVPNAVNTALTGIPYWGTDIGGFVPTAEYTGELHVRWFQFGAFCTLFRAHGRDWHLRLPWGWNTGSVGVSEIANYTGGAADPDPSELRNPHVEPICRKYLELRYQLMPYLYSAVRECTETGMPIMRALWLHYPHDATAVARGDQYLWGRDILVAPVVEKGATRRRVYLPQGQWYDFWTNDVVAGGSEVERAVDLETMPLYVRAGAIIPMGPVRQYTSETVDEPLTLVVYPGTDGEFDLYEDDGSSFDYRTGAWMGINIRWRDAERRLTLALTPGSQMLPPSPRPIVVRLAGSESGSRVNFSGEPVQIRL